MKRTLMLLLVLGMFAGLAIVQAAASENYQTVKPDLRGT